MKHNPSWLTCHKDCIIDNIVELMDRGYTCYPEYELTLGQKKKVIADIYAVKDDKQILIEVGYLSSIHGNRLDLLKSLMPKAKIIHIHQWKNYFSVRDFDQEYYQWLMLKYAWNKDREMYDLLIRKEIDPRDALGLAAHGIKWKDANYEIGMSMGKPK